METVFGARRLDDHLWNFMIDDQKKIGYIRIATFSRHTAEDVRSALVQLTGQGMKGLILDLRFDPGGLLSTAIEVADFFLSKGTIVSTSGRNAQQRTWLASQPGTYEGFEMAVLVNGYSASASEIVAACLQDHGRAVVIGERSWGKGSVQNIIELEGGRSALKLTTAGYQRPSGKNIHRAEGAGPEQDWGVRPNEGFEVSLTRSEARRLLEYHQQWEILPSRSARAEQTVEPHVDRQLQRALDHLSERIQSPVAAK
jgi:carboxyl-terminal processing protease